MRFLAQLMTRQVRQFASTWDADHATARPSAPQPPFVTGLLARRSAGHQAHPRALAGHWRVRASFALSATKEPAKTRRIHASTRGRLTT